MATFGEVDNISCLKIVYYLFSLLLLLFKYYTTTKGLEPRPHFLLYTQGQLNSFHGLRKRF